MSRPLACALVLAVLSGAAAAAEKKVGSSGLASVYSHRGKTASGEPGDPKAMTAAHRSLPFGTLVQVTNARNGRSATVRINDRGPFSKKRVIDVTPVAARQLGFSGLAPVRLETVGPCVGPC